MDLIRINTSTQVSTVACFIKMLVLDCGGSASVALRIYDEATSSETTASRKLTMRNTEGELTKVIIFPGRGLRLPNGCWMAYEGGEVFYALG
ncbi:unnamed protein product [marine sediment metagenome]|uniref:Uncharacterized protein n=1 Tax=marine sediment metagenome TaxID=412755 RepID=X1ATV3_9ZZZZ